MFLCNLSITFGIIIKGKLGLDVGQPRILIGDTGVSHASLTLVSHTSPKDSCGTPWYHHQLVFLVVPPSTGFPLVPLTHIEGMAIETLCVGGVMCLCQIPTRTPRLQQTVFSQRPLLPPHKSPLQASSITLPIVVSCTRDLILGRQCTQH